MARIKVGVIGGGGVAQIEHVSNLLRLKDKFEIVGVCDPSPAVRKFMLDRYAPSFKSALANLPGSAKTLRRVAVEVSDPDAWHTTHSPQTILKGTLS